MKYVLTLPEWHHRVT